jgi:ribosomal protein S18 acetylase RimI-like enzyme
VNNPDTPAKVVRLPPQRLDELQELWSALYEHHHSLTPHLRPRARSLRHAWCDHLALERGWLEEDPRSFVLAAELNSRLVGYAFVRIATETLAVSWTISNPHADLVVLSVLPELRGRGIGTMLIDAVHTQPIACSRSNRCVYNVRPMPERWWPESTYTVTSAAQR